MQGYASSDAPAASPVAAESQDMPRYFKRAVVLEEFHVGFHVSFKGKVHERLRKLRVFVGYLFQEGASYTWAGIELPFVSYII